MTAAVDDPVARPVREGRGPRGRVWLYAVAFAMLLVSGWLQARGNFTSSLTLVWSSIALSGVALVVAVLSVVVPGRRPRPAKVDPAPRARRITTEDGSDARAASASAAPRATVEPRGDEPGSDDERVRRGQRGGSSD